MSNSADGRLRLATAARSDVGLVRSGNEDSGYAGTDLVLIADGIGGHAAGEIASSVTARGFAALDRADPESPERDLLAVLATIHETLSSLVASHPQYEGMGTTLTLVQRVGDAGLILHIGDSRLYRLRDGTLEQVSRDHSLVQELVDLGEITPAEAAVHPRRSMITRAVDGYTDPDPDLLQCELVLGDRLLLCSDGLSDVVGPEALRTLLAESGDGDQTAAALIEAALAGGGPDNITVVIADVVDADTPRPDPVGLVGAAAQPDPVEAEPAADTGPGKPRGWRGWLRRGGS